MTKYVTKGTVSAALSVLAIIAGAFGKGQLAAFFSSPDTAATILTVIGAGGAIYAGVAEGLKTAPVAAAA